MTMKKPLRQQFLTFILPLGRTLVEGKKRGRDHVLYDAPAALLFHASPYTDSAAVEATIPLLPMPASVRPKCRGWSHCCARR